MKYITILIILLLITCSILLLINMSSFLFHLISKETEVAKIPFMGNYYIAKVDKKTYSQGEDLEVDYYFTLYIREMEKMGWNYIPEKRLGGILFFEKMNKTITRTFPKFIALKWQ